MLGEAVVRDPALLASAAGRQLAWAATRIFCLLDGRSIEQHLRIAAS